MFSELKTFDCVLKTAELEVNWKAICKQILIENLSENRIRLGDLSFVKCNVCCRKEEEESARLDNLKSEMCMWQDNILYKKYKFIFHFNNYFYKLNFGVLRFFGHLNLF